MPTVLTLMFGGSGHSLVSDRKDDKFPSIFTNISSSKAYFPGPGGDQKNTDLYCSSDLRDELGAERPDLHPVKRSDKSGAVNYDPVHKFAHHEAGSNKVTGTGWNQNAYHAVRVIWHFVDKYGAHITLNLVGHSRGSITIIMLLNDLLYTVKQTQEVESMTVPRKYKAKIVKYDGKVPYERWYEMHLKSIWDKRIGHNAGQNGLDKLNDLADPTVINKINMFMFDPVGGPFKSDVDRKKLIPVHPKIKHVRLIRMEHGGAHLQDNLPGTVGILTNLTGEDPSKTADVNDYTTIGKYEIPLPGSHGAGISYNIKKNVLRTQAQRLIGLSYLYDFLTSCNTTLKKQPGKYFNDDNRYFTLYHHLADEFDNKPAKSKKRDPFLHNRANDRYRRTPVGNVAYINGHHRFLIDKGCTIVPGFP